MTRAPLPGPPPAPRGADDLALVRAALRGETVALDAFVDRLARLPGMVRDQHRRLGGPLDEHELLDVVQETLAAVWSKLGTFEGRASLETWVWRFARNELFKALERRHRRDRERAPAHGDDEPDELGALGAVAGGDEPARVEARLLHRCLARLEPAAADVVRRRHFERMRFPDIAAATGEPLGTVKTRYYRAIDRLRILLTPHRRRAER